MNRLILASATLFAFAGAAAAQEAPALIYGDSYAQNVQNVSDGASMGFAGSASATRPDIDRASATVTGQSGLLINQNQNYSGK